MQFAPAPWGTPVVQSTADRGLLFPVPGVDQRVFNKETGNTERWNGTGWVVDLTGSSSGSVPVPDGVTDLATALQTVINATATGATLTLPPSSLDYIIGTGLTLPRLMTISGYGATIKAKDGAAITDMILATDVDGGKVMGLTIDCNSTALCGLTGAASTRSPDGITWEDCVVKNIGLAGVNSASYGAYRIYSSDTGATKRFKNVRLVRCRADTGVTGVGVGGLGATIAYADGVDIIDWRADNMGLHGFEAVGCTRVRASGIRGSNCGGSGAAIGDHSYDFTLEDIDLDNCSGDGAITVENTCAYGKVTNFRAVNCAKPGVSVSFGTAGTVPNDTVRAIEVSHGFVRTMAPLAITGITKTNPAVFTVASTARLNWNTILLSFSGISGMTQMNGLNGTVTVLSSTTFSVPIDATGFSTYTSGGVAGVYQPGINAYATSPNYGAGIQFHRIDTDGFNRAIDMRYMTGSGASDITATNLQGPSTYVGLFQEIQRSRIKDITCADSQCTHATGAFQFTSLGAVYCDDVHVSGLYAFLCQQSDGVTYTPLAYLEGNGSVFFDNLRTQGALNYLSIPAGATPVVTLTGSKGAVTSNQIGGAGAVNARVLQQFGNASGLDDVTVVNGKKRAARSSAPIVGDRIANWTLGDIVKNSAPSVGQPKGWMVTTNGTLVTALSSITGAITTGTKTLVVSSVSSMVIGNYITIAGVTGTKQIAGISGTTLTLDSNANATVSGAAVQYASPTFQSEGNL